MCSWYASKRWGHLGFLEWGNLRKGGDLTPPLPSMDDLKIHSWFTSSKVFYHFNEVIFFLEPFRSKTLSICNTINMFFLFILMMSLYVLTVETASSHFPSYRLFHLTHHSDTFHPQLPSVQVLVSPPLCSLLLSY